MFRRGDPGWGDLAWQQMLQQRCRSGAGLMASSRDVWAGHLSYIHSPEAMPHLPRFIRCDAATVQSVACVAPVYPPHRRNFNINVKPPQLCTCLLR